ncbi:MAG: TSUP family transporter [Egibacteraceae bacterium]
MTETLIIVAAIAVGAFVKGVTGSGLPQIAIPVMASFLGVERSVVIMAIPGVVSNLWLIWTFRHAFGGSRDLPVLLTVGIGGVVLGTWLLQALDPRILALTLAVLVVVYVVLFLSPVEVSLSPRVTRWTAPPVGLAAGALQGATGISGPLVQSYLHAYRFDKQVYVVSIVTIYGVFSVVQTLSVAGLGLYTSGRLMESALALVPMAIMLPFGARVSRHISQRVFDYSVLALLIASAAKLVYDAAVGV